MILSRSSLWSPLASVIAFGLLGSMFFTLLLIPVLFVVAHRKRRPAHKPLTKRAQPEKAVVALLLLFALTGLARAETRRITLDEAVRLATTQNSMVKMAHMKVRETDARVTQARASYFPVLSNDTNAVHLGEMDNLVIPQGALGTYPSDGEIPGKNISIKLGNQDFLLTQTTAAQPITQLFKIHAAVSAAHADAGIARADAQRAEDEVALKMKELYLNLLSLERRKQAAELRIEASEEQLTEAQNGVAAGAVLEIKVLEGKAQIAEARHALGSLEDAISDMQVEFNDLAGLPLETEVELVAPPMEKHGEATGDLETQALQRNPEVAAARQSLAKAKAGLSAAHAEYIPDIGIFAQYVYQNGVPLLSENNGAIGLKMNWTLAEFGKRSGEVHERKAQVAEAEENLHHAENQVRIEMEKNLRKLRRAETGLEAARESVDARTEMRRITADQVEAKAVNASALKEAGAQLAEAEAGLFQAEAERSTAQAELERTLGEE